MDRTVGAEGDRVVRPHVRDRQSHQGCKTDRGVGRAGLGLPDLTRHGLRHTGATWMADSGIPLHVLQKILGHQSLETTRKYMHADHRHLASAAKQANAFLANWSPSGPPFVTEANPERKAGTRADLLGDQRGTRDLALRKRQCLMKLASHQAFSVGLTGFEPATP